MKNTVDIFYYHEALDRTSVLLDNVVENLSDHLEIIGDKEAINYYEESLGRLLTLYQRLGKLRTNFEKEK